MAIAPHSKRSEAVHRVLSVSAPLVMGILNTTPDSFSDGGKFAAPDAAFEHLQRMVKSGAHIIDIGGESTRPGAESVDEQTELERVLPVLEQGIKAFPEALFSVDTTKYAVAEAALKAGAHIINDVSGLRKEPRLASLCAAYGASLILMHSIGTPKTMQHEAWYSDVVEEVLHFLKTQAAFATAQGCPHLILDPGIGFGKTLEHNLALITQLPRLTALGYPVLIGASRKAMIGALLQQRPIDGRLAGTLLVHYECLVRGASVLRVHDVQEAADSVAIYHTFHRSGSTSLATEV